MSRPLLQPRLLPMLLVLTGMAGCSTVNNSLEGSKVDYKTSGSKTVSLDVPPDLTQLTRDSRYQPVGGTISASGLQGAAPVAGVPSTTSPVTPAATDALRIDRAGSQRWLTTTLPPEQLWPQLEAFWQERGFVLETDARELGWMQTNWVENRTKVPQDFIRNTIGRVFEGLYDSGERDQFRTRVERTATGTEVYISHRGMVEVYTNERKESTDWQSRPSDPELEALMLTRLMIKLGAQPERAQTAVANAAPTAASAKARMLAGPPGTGMEVDDPLDRAWRRVGLALDRTGFTVEDRDRAQGVYFVRYVDPAQSGKGEPGFFSRLFGGDKDGAPQGGLARYRIALTGQGEVTKVAVQNSQGQAETGDAAQRILSLLVTDLK